MGHIIDTNDYNKAFRDQGYAADEYLKAEPWLNIISEDPERVPLREHQRLQREIGELRKAVKEAEWLLSDPETARILRNLVEERRQRAI